MFYELHSTGSARLPLQVMLKIAGNNGGTRINNVFEIWTFTNASERFRLTFTIKKRDFKVNLLIGAYVYEFQKIQVVEML